MQESRCDVTHKNEELVNQALENKSSFEQILETSKLFKSLGNETRLGIVDVIKDQEMCVCDIAVVLDMTQSAISHQLSKLKASGIVKARRDGLTIYYSLADDHIKDLYMLALSHIIDCN